MSALTETSLTSMNAAFPTTPAPIHGIPSHASLIDLMMNMCCCLQTQKTPASATMNMLFLVASSDLYLYLTNKHTLQVTSPSQRKLMMFQTSSRAHPTTSAKVLKLHMPTTKKLKQT
jgi:hypothetical protein